MACTQRSEDSLLRMIDAAFPNQHPSLVLARGDDCAVLGSGGPWAITSDIFVENSHFRTAYFSPQAIGHKALAVNISDLAASGAAPTAFVLNLTLTGNESDAWLTAFFQGMAKLATAQNMVLAGGDLARAGGLNIGITAWGRLEQPCLCRGQAEVGDILFVVGRIGLSRVALDVLENALMHSSHEGQTRFKPAGAPTPDSSLFPAALHQHFFPQPQVAAGLAIARLAVAWPQRFSLMDVSDGLARDLPRLLGRAKAPSLGALLNLPPHFLHPEILAHVPEPNQAAAYAYEGGEDYALLGSCPPPAWPALCAAVPEVWQLGQVTEQGIFLNGQPCCGQGFDHFAATL